MATRGVMLRPEESRKVVSSSGAGLIEEQQVQVDDLWPGNHDLRSVIRSHLPVSGL